MSEPVWPIRMRDAFRVELRAEAIGFAGRGWPVVPGSRVDDRPPDDDVEQWSRPAPVQQYWREQASANPNKVAAIWAEHPYSLLVSTGTVLDALEVGAELGKRAASLLRRVSRPVPIIALPDGQWLFLTRVADRLSEELAGRDDVSWHSGGSWIPLPPTPVANGVVHWRVKPTAWGWRLPSHELVHNVLLRALYDADAAVVQRLGGTESSAA